jgi:hypothetical protein
MILPVFFFPFLNVHSTNLPSQMSLFHKFGAEYFEARECTPCVLVSEAVQGCLMAMEVGDLDVDIQDETGNVLAACFVACISENARRDLWLRYMSLLPRLALVWRTIARWNIQLDTQTLLKSVDGLWHDLACVIAAHPLKHVPMCCWVCDEVKKRMQTSLRRAWIFAVVARE